MHCTRLTFFVIFMGRILRTGAFTSGCPDIVLRSKHFAKVYDKTCYLFVNQERYWNDARSACWNMGGEMLSIKDRNTMQFIRSALSSRHLRWFNKGVWLGARYTRGSWRWTTGMKVQYENWADGEPSKVLNLISFEDCAVMRRDDNWRWHDYLCGSFQFHYKYICEFPFDHHDTHEIWSRAQLKDNGNMAVLTFILVTGGILLLILLLVFIIVRRQYNYKRLMRQPDVHFENRNDSHAVCQTVPLPEASSHQEPSSVSQRSHSHSASDMYLMSVDTESSLEEKEKATSTSKSSQKESVSCKTLISCIPSDENLGACGGISYEETEDSVINPLVYVKGELVQKQSEGSLCSILEPKEKKPKSSN